MKRRGICRRLRCRRRNGSRKATGHFYRCSKHLIPSASQLRRSEPAMSGDIETFGWSSASAAADRRRSERWTLPSSDADLSLAPLRSLCAGFQVCMGLASTTKVWSKCHAEYYIQSSTLRLIICRALCPSYFLLFSPRRPPLPPRQYSIALYPGGRCVPIGRGDFGVYRGLYALAGVDIVDVAFGADFFLALTSTHRSTSASPTLPYRHGNTVSVSF